jgi:hypothetical protein
MKKNLSVYRKGGPDPETKNETSNTEKVGGGAPDTPAENTPGGAGGAAESDTKENTETDKKDQSETNEGGETQETAPAAPVTEEVPTEESVAEDAPKDTPVEGEEVKTKEE